MENRIKEQQLHLFADRTSAETMRANQIRLFFSSIAYTLLEALRRLGLTETSMAQAQCQTIRLAVEDRCLGASDCAESLGAIGQQLPLRRCVPSSLHQPGSIATGDAAMLTRD